MLKMNPRILHVSCHGEIDYSTKSSCLIFVENQQHGKGIRVLKDEMNVLLSSVNLEDIEVVFLAACHSEEIGQLFVDKGVSHVVCVKMTRCVLD